jgi:hypothetical protein
VYTFSMSLVQKSLAILLATFFLGGFFLCMGMTSSSHYTMADSHQLCPIMGGTGPCQNSMDHLSYWQTIFSVIPSEFFSALIALLTACACLWLVCRGIWKPHRHVLVPEWSPPIRTYLLPRSYLQEAFSNGILHSKAF